LHQRISVSPPRFYYSALWLLLLWALLNSLSYKQLLRSFSFGKGHTHPLAPFFLYLADLTCFCRSSGRLVSAVQTRTIVSMLSPSVETAPISRLILFRFSITLTSMFLQELWTLLNFLLPDIFQLKDLEAAGSRSDDPDTQASLIGRLKTILAPFVLRRVKADVMQQLVAKEQKVCFPGNVLWRCEHRISDLRGSFRAFQASARARCCRMPVDSAIAEP
jgi:hypothetical protein